MPSTLTHKSTSIEDIGKLLFLIHKSIQRSRFNQLDGDSKLKGLRNDLLEDPIYLPYIDLIDRKNINRNVIQTAQDFLEEDGKFPLLNGTAVSVNCRNPTIVQVDGNIISSEVITLRDRLAFSRNNFEQGSCLTCGRDRTPLDQSGNLSVSRKRRVEKPNCIFYEQSKRDIAFFELEIDSAKGGNRTIISRFHLRLSRSIADLVLHEVRGGQIFQQKVVEEIEAATVSTDKIGENKIKLNLLSVGSRKNIGFSGALRSIGFAPLVNMNSNRNHKGIPLIIDILQEFIRNICFYWNPLNYERIMHVLGKRMVKNYEDLTIGEESNKNVDARFWPLKCIRVGGITLQSLLNASNEVRLETALSQNIFVEVEDNSIPENSMEFIMDDISFWM